MALTDMSSIRTTSLLSAFLLLIFGSYLYRVVNLYFRKQKFIKSHNCKPLLHHVENKDPILGLQSLFEISKAAKEHRLLELFEIRFATRGNTLSNHLMGQSIITTCEPENIKSVLSLNFKDFSVEHRDVVMGPLLGTGIFNSQGPAWSHSRAMIRPAFSKDQVADIEAFERHMQDLFPLIPKDGSTVDLQELFFRYTIDSATEFLFGRSVHSLRESPDDNPSSVETPDTKKVTGAQFAEAFNAAQDFIVKQHRLGNFRIFTSKTEGNKLNKICHDYVDPFVLEALQYQQDLESGKSQDLIEKTGGHQYVFSRKLANVTKDRRQIRDELMNVLLAGRDTTASLLSNMWFVIAKRPEIFAKLKQEVEETLHGELPTYEQLRGMKYLKWCLNEALRLYPVVPVNNRMASNDTVLPLGGGEDGKSPIFVAKGTLVTYSVWAMHRRKDLFGSDADEFRPERWDSIRPSWEYLPFNGGPRICIGQQYALTEAGYVTARLVQAFKGVESRDDNGGVWMEKVALSMCSLHGTKVAVQWEE